jgi:hypothetical protein
MGNHVAQETAMDFPAKFSTTRLAHEGSDPSDAWRVVGVGHSKIDIEKVNVVNIRTIAEYEHGCQLHEKCLGHLCRSPYGMILPMQSLAISTSVIRNDISRASNAAFSGAGQYHSTQYKKILSDSMKSKTGRMRKGILNCHIDGSLRMVIGPQEHTSANVVLLPQYLKDIWTVLYLDPATNKYTRRKVVEGDRAIAVRPPALSVKSVQPVIISYWNETYVGISPDILKAFDGDFDGDEMQFYPVYSSDAIRECMEWSNTPNQTFIKAREVYQDCDIEHKGNDMYSFMYHTTLSFQEIKNGVEQPLMAEQARTRLEHLVGFRERYDIESVSRSFVRESVRGMGDTNDQQLSQPVVGDMSRIARIAASCVLQRDDGTIGVATTSGFSEVCIFDKDMQDGSACMRAVSTICAGSQQATLESHHAKKKSLPQHNITTDMIKGLSETVILVDRRLSESRIRIALRPRWQDKGLDGTYVLCKASGAGNLPKSYILGSYNPTILSKFDESERLEICRRGVEAVVRYSSFEFSATQIMSLAVLFSFKVEDSPYPITTREGISARGLRWTEVMMANHYNMLIEMLDKGNIPFSPLDTISSCLMGGNFTGL